MHLAQLGAVRGLKVLDALRLPSLAGLFGLEVVNESGQTDISSGWLNAPLLIITWSHVDCPSSASDQRSNMWKFSRCVSSGRDIITAATMMTINVWIIRISLRKSKFFGRRQAVSFFFFSTITTRDHTAVTVIYGPIPNSDALHDIRRRLQIRDGKILLESVAKPIIKKIG